MVVALRQGVDDELVLAVLQVAQDDAVGVRRLARGGLGEDGLRLALLVDADLRRLLRRARDGELVARLELDALGRRGDRHAGAVVDRQLLRRRVLASDRLRDGQVERARHVRCVDRDRVAAVLQRCRRRDLLLAVEELDLGLRGRGSGDRRDLVELIAERGLGGELGDRQVDLDLALGDHLGAVEGLEGHRGDAELQVPEGRGPPAIGDDLVAGDGSTALVLVGHLDRRRLGGCETIDQLRCPRFQVNIRDRRGECLLELRVQGCVRAERVLAGDLPSSTHPPGAQVPVTTDRLEAISPTGVLVVDLDPLELLGGGSIAGLREPSSPVRSGRHAEIRAHRLDGPRGTLRWKAPRGGVRGCSRFGSGWRRIDRSTRCRSLPGEPLIGEILLYERADDAAVRRLRCRCRTEADAGGQGGCGDAGRGRSSKE